ncbi:MAG: RNase adapter RapZ [Rhodospirillaceae bacterium]
MQKTVSLRASRITVITGMSGAGRTSALKVLEDLGFEAVDNLPLSMMTDLVGLRMAAPSPLAVGIDCRTRGFDVGAVERVLDSLGSGAGGEDVPDSTLVFVDCDDDVLRRRFTETRRPHPLAAGRPVGDGIAQERALLAPLKARADLVLDTTNLPPGELRRRLEEALGAGDGQGLTVFVTSFGFRNGLPREADLVFDVRFLSNPHYDPDLRDLTGLDAPVAAHVAADPDYESFFTRLTDLLSVLVPRYQAEGKSYLTIAVGCTGGRHRSVYTAERLAAWLGDQSVGAHVRHRDLVAVQERRTP